MHIFLKICVHPVGKQLKQYAFFFHRFYYTPDAFLYYSSVQQQTNEKQINLGGCKNKQFPITELTPNSSASNMFLVCNS